MPNPTGNYGWTFPAENADPWYDGHIDGLQAIDTTVASLQRIAVPRVTCVLSVFPTGTLTVSSATGQNMTTDGVWTICSVAPYGRCVGSFALVASGAHAVFDVRWAGYAPGVVASFCPAGPLFVRGVITSAVGANSLVSVTSGTWRHRVQFTDTYQGAAFTATRSLGPGLYSFELQAQFRAQTTQTSRWVTDTDGQILVHVLEAIRPSA